jgi:hypothetical protein
MERLLKWIDDLDDLAALTRLLAGPIVVTLLLLFTFIVAVAAVMVLGPPDLLAAP